jgi:putative ABC transport system ATP-binding protein
VIGTLIQLAHVSRSFAVGERTIDAVKDVTLAIAAGQHVALVGPSGSGKSTLLNLIGGLDRPSSGTLVVDGRDISQLSPSMLAAYRRTTIGFVFQTFRLLRDLTALENAALPLVLAGRGHAAAESDVAPLLERVGLGRRFSHRPAQLSVGQQQRVALARALANRPRIVLADEPTANLDAESAEEVLGLLVELQRERALTVLVATHDAAVAARAGIVVHLEHGRAR